MQTHELKHMQRSTRAHPSRRAHAAKERVEATSTRSVVPSRKVEHTAPLSMRSLNCSWMSLPNRDELLLRTVCALPKASSTGLELRTLSTTSPLLLSLALSAAVVARNFSRIFVVSVCTRDTWRPSTPSRSHSRGGVYNTSMGAGRRRLYLSFRLRSRR